MFFPFVFVITLLSIPVLIVAFFVGIALRKLGWMSE